MTFSDETLLAYLNGALDDAGVRAIEDAIEQGDPDLEQRLMAMDPFAAAVHSVFEEFPGHQPEVHLPPVSPAVSSGWSRLRPLALAASVAAVAVWATLWATRPAPLGWAEQAAIYQSLYGPDTIAGLDNRPETLDAQFAQAEAQLGRSLNPETLLSLPGAELKRTQILTFNGKVLVQVVFADPQGRPFAFCVIRQGQNAPGQAVEHAVLSGLATATWAQDGYGYMLIGPDAQADLGPQLEALTEAFAGPGGVQRS